MNDTPSAVQVTYGKSSHVVSYLLIFYFALIAYVSLTPFTGWQASRFGPWTFLTQGWPRYATRFDIALNFLAYLPFGLLLYAAIAVTRARTTAVTLTAAIGFCLSFVLEFAQSFLEFRIASLADLVSNSAGCLIGALLGAWLGRTTNIQTLLLRWRHELFFSGTTIDIGLALLCVWLISQLNPSIPFFGAGVVSGASGGYDEGYAYQPPTDTPFALGTALNFCGVGLFVATLMRARSHALVALQVLTGLAFCLKLAAAYALLRPEVSAEWHSNETLTGLAAGFIALLPLSFLRLNHRIYLAAILILAGGLLSKMAGNYTSLTNMLRLFDWPYGQLLQFTGLTLYLNEIWPLVALIFLFWYWLRQQWIEFARL